MSHQGSDLIDGHYSRLMLSINQNQYDMKQGIQSFYTSHYKSTIKGPKLNIVNVQSLTEKERDLLIQGIKKLQPKISVEYSQNDSHQKLQIGRKQKVQDCQSKIKSKPLYPSLQIQDPKELSNEFKIQYMKDMLQKKTTETAEMSKRLKQLEIQNEELKIERRNIQESQEATTRIIVDSYKEEVNTMVKSKINNWELQKQELQRNYKLQIQTLSEKHKSLQTKYQFQIATLEDKLKQYEEKRKENQLKELKEQKSVLKKQWQNKNYVLQSQLELKTRQAETFYIQKFNLQLMVQQLEAKIVFLQQQQVQNKKQHQTQMIELQSREQQKNGYYTNKIANYQSYLKKEKQERQRDAQILLTMQEKIKQLEKNSVKTKLQYQENQKNNNKILQDKLKQYIKELKIFQGQKQKMLNSYEKIQKENQIIKNENKQLTILRQKLQSQISQLRIINEQRSQKIHYLQRQVQEIKNVSKDVELQRQMFTEEVQDYKINLDKKDETIKQLKDKNKRFQQELVKNKGEYKVMFDKVERQNLQIQSILKSQSDYKQKIKKLQQENKYLQTQMKKQTNTKSSQLSLLENQLKRIKIQKDKIQHKLNQEVAKYNILYQETNSKAYQFENQLKTIKMEKERLQQKLLQEANRYKILEQQSIKIKQGNFTESDRIQHLQKTIQKYQHELKWIKQVQLANAKKEVSNLHEKIAQNQSRPKTPQIPATRQERLSILFELLRGFKSKMTAPEISNLRSKISYIMN